MRIRAVVLGGLLILGWVAASRGAERAAAAASGELQGIQFDAASGTLAVQIKTTVPVPLFSCLVSPNPVREVVLSLPRASSHLQNHYELDGRMVRDAQVETADGVAGVRVRFRLGEGELSGVEQTAQGIVIRFTRPVTGVDGAAVQADYTIGIGDKLEISVFGHEDLNRTVEVRNDGDISYPLIGDLKVAGKTASKVDAEITDALGKDYLVEPQVGVEVKESQSQWVTILGEVRNPGKYLLKRNMRVIDLMAEAGGPTKDAGQSIGITHRDRPGSDPRQIVVERDKLFATDNQEANLALSPGDVVSLSEKEVFYIRGEVTKPGPYFLEKGMTVLKAITFAGGLGQFANRKEITLLRSEGNRVQKKVNVNLKSIEDGKAPDIALQANDLIIVPRRVF